MPVLHKYNESYHKSGYYIKVNWSAPHPYPLQTPAITEQIYSELDFEPGDDVPNELTSRLFNAGLHWTEGNGPGNPDKQTVTNSITDANLPSLTQAQLDRLYDLLDDAESHIETVGTNSDDINELKRELDTLQNKTGNTTPEFASDSIPDRTVNILREFEGDIAREKTSVIRGGAANRQGFDHALEQFVRNHLITPYGFEINEHGDPTFTFQTASTVWKLADCRPKRLDFDWAVTVAADSDHAFGLRIRSNELVRIVSATSQLSEQQATDLITITPCLLWTLNTLNDYQFTPQWHVSLVEDMLPSSKYEQFEVESEDTLQALNSTITPNQGTIIDIPDTQFARIRSPENCIICTPVASLPNDAELGSEVTFDVQQRYETYYGTNVSIADQAKLSSVDIVDLEKEINARLLDGFETGDFPYSLQPINKSELSVDIDRIVDDEKPEFLKIRTEQFADSDDYWGYTRIEFFISKTQGLDSVNVLTDLTTSWEAKGEMYELVGCYLPIIATTLDDNDINPGSCDNSVPIGIETI